MKHAAARLCPGAANSHPHASPLKVIRDDEVAVVEQGVRRFSRLKHYRVDVKKNAITVFEANQDEEYLADLVEFVSRARAEEIFARSCQYTATMRFVLDDDEKRAFQTQRYCFRGSIDDWIDVGRPGSLPKLVKEYVRHLGQESFYDLM